MAIIFPFEANWQEQISVDREYKTEIIQSRNLTEQRKALRQEPRRRFEVSVQTTQVRADDAWQFFESRAQEAFVMPDFTRTRALFAAAAKNSNQITIPGASGIPWLMPGANLVLGSPARTRLPVMHVSAPVDGLWKYKVEAAGSVADYSAAGYDDSAWVQDIGGFGESFGPTPEEGTYVAPGSGVSIWVRFTLPAGPSDEGFMLTLWHDDGPELWIDGVSTPLPPQTLGAGDYFRSRVYVPAKSTAQVVAYKVTDAVPYGNPTYIYAGVEYESATQEAEVVEVISVAGDVVTVSNVTSDRPAGTLVRPAIYGRLDQSIQGSFETLTSGAWSITFIEDPNDTYREAYVSAPDARFFDGREVFLRKPNWMERASPAVQGYLETLMMDRGVFAHRIGQAFNHRLWDATYRSMDADAVEDLIQFVHRNRGRRGEFWMPTFRRDLKPVGMSAKAGYYLLVEGLEAKHRLSGSHRIMIEHPGGNYEFHEIESVAAVGDNTNIRLRDPLQEVVVGYTGDIQIDQQQITLSATANAGIVGNGIRFENMRTGGKVTAELVGTEAWSAWSSAAKWLTGFHIVWDSGDVTYHDLSPGGGANAPYPSAWNSKAEAVANAHMIQFTALSEGATVVLDYGYVTTDNSGTMTIELTSYNTGKPERISHMPLWRLATDTLSIQFPTTRVADAKISMQQITLDENYDGHYPIATIVNAGDVTYNISGYKFISTAETKGRAVIRWDRVATRISTGDPATATLSVRVRCRNGASSIIRDKTISATGYGLVSLDDYVDIPAATVYVQLTFTTTSAVPGDTTVAAATIKSMEIRGRP